MSRHRTFLFLLLIGLSMGVTEEDEEDDGSLAIPLDALHRPIHPQHILQGGEPSDPSSNHCYCSYGTEEGICLEGEICVKEPNAACYHYVEEKYNEEAKRMETVHMFGCATLEKGSAASHFTCNSHLPVHYEPKSIACCYEGNLCNLNLTPAPYAGLNPHAPVLSELPSLPPVHNGWLYAIVVIMALALIITPLVWWKKQSIRDYMKKNPINDNIFPFAKSSGDSELCKEKEVLIDMTGSGSGSCGGPTAIERTVAQDITVIRHIGQGRYGEVRLAQYRGSYVAVKTFYTTDEESWENERAIYHSEMFNHENVLQFVAADIYSEDSTTHMVLITDYHELGSLHEYLKNREVIEEDEAYQLVFSIICGLEHLHSVVRGTGGKRKAQIAHRDLKSKNIIVKRPGVCCIADFGLAIRFNDREMIPAKPKIQVGTKRYMAPEILDKTLDPINFSNFKSADMYAFALIMWEIITRVEIECVDPSSPVSHRRSEKSESGIGESINSSSLEGHGPTPKAQHQKHSSEMTLRLAPYEDVAPSDPSFELMKTIVCDQKLRPRVDEEWINGKHEHLGSLVHLMTACWHAQPQVRLTALNVKLKLRQLIDSKKSQQRTLSEQSRTLSQQDSGVATSNMITNNTQAIALCK